MTPEERLEQLQRGGCKCAGCIVNALTATENEAFRSGYESGRRDAVLEAKRVIDRSLSTLMRGEK